MSLGDAVIDAVQRQNPVAAKGIDRLTELASGTLGPRLESLIAARVRAILDPRITEASAGALSDAEAAVLDFVDQYVMQVSGMTDKQVQGLLPYYSPEQVFSLVHAVYAVDGRERTRLVLDGFTGNADG